MHIPKLEQFPLIEQLLTQGRTTSGISTTITLFIMSPISGCLLPTLSTADATILCVVPSTKGNTTVSSVVPRRIGCIVSILSETNNYYKGIIMSIHVSDATLWVPPRL